MQETLVVRRERHIPAPPAAARRFGLFSWGDPHKYLRMNWPSRPFSGRRGDGI
jgi:hypothetical protein